MFKILGLLCLSTAYALSVMYLNGVKLSDVQVSCLAAISTSTGWRLLLESIKTAFSPNLSALHSVLVVAVSLFSSCLTASADTTHPELHMHSWDRFFLLSCMWLLLWLSSCVPTGKLFPSLPHAAVYVLLRRVMSLLRRRRCRAC
jgi:hypothetical protein